MLPDPIAGHLLLVHGHVGGWLCWWMVSWTLSLQVGVSSVPGLLTSTIATTIAISRPNWNAVSFDWLQDSGRDGCDRRDRLPDHLWLLADGPEPADVFSLVNH